LRVVRTDKPKGFYTKTDFSSWNQKVYDENDVVLSSDYYLANKNNADAGFADELDALKKAVPDDGTPVESRLDSQGHAFFGRRTAARRRSLDRA